MLLSWNVFTMLTSVTFLAFRLAINVPLMILTSFLLALYMQSNFFIMANHTCMASQHSAARPSWSVV